MTELPPRAPSCGQRLARLDGGDALRFDHVGAGGGQGGPRVEHVDAWMDVQ